MKLRSICSTPASVLVVCGTLAGLATPANTPNNISIFFVPPAADGVLPIPVDVSGKEYTDKPDVDANAGTLRSGQIVLWDGSGGAANGPTVGIPGAAFQIDALANVGDVLFDAVIQNRAHLLVSVERDSPTASIWYESMDGSKGVWATKNQVNSNGVGDLDALEVWGTDGSSDATHVSFAGDPSGVAIFTLGAAPLVTDFELGTAIGLSRDLIDEFDLDGLMMLGSNLLFSIEPILDPASGAVLYDGGEIWTYSIGSLAPAAFLNHGGHLWDTAFDVRGAFGVDSENIDALEAVSASNVVPETKTWLGAGVLALAAAAQIRRRFIRG